jgi:pimeloyl-ACP methyl ester carboxylesterase
MPFLEIRGHRLEYRWTGPAEPAGPSIVFLHEGLGSVGLWRDFPDRLAAAARCPALIYSRQGHGRSDPPAHPRTARYLHDEALLVLPELLSRLQVNAPVLVCHSDGASIALIHAADGRWPVRGLVLEAPHVFVEDVTLAGIERAGMAFRDGHFARGLARHHGARAEPLFWAWHDTWLSPGFRGWNIERDLPRIACPILAIQGAEDEYGTTAQSEAIARQASGPVETLVLPGCGHSPHREQPETVLAAMARFVSSAGRSGVALSS